MAITVSVVISTVAGDDTSRNIIQVPECMPRSAELIDLTELTMSKLTAEPEQFWIITVVGGDVWARFSPPYVTPLPIGAPLPEEVSAAPGKDWLIADGSTREFSASMLCSVSFIPAAGA